MSNLEDAIIAAIRDDNDTAVILTGYVVVTSVADPSGDDSTWFTYTAASGQSVALSLGLLEMGKNYFARRVGTTDDD